MAKKQTFGDKANSKKNAKDMIKVIKSSKSNDSGTLRFSTEMVRVPDGKSADNVVKEMLSK
jgi:hypothetical protein